MKSQKGKCAQGHTARKSPGQGSSSDSLTPGLLLVTTVIETCNAGASPHLVCLPNHSPQGPLTLPSPPDQREVALFWLEKLPRCSAPGRSL